MPKNYAQHLTDKLVTNTAGGKAYEISHWDQLDRFLILGTEGGSYYASEKAMTLDNVTSIQKCLEEDGPKLVARIVEISQAGRAPKNDPAIFALAVVFSKGDDRTKQAARLALPKVCRIGTHLFQLLSMIDGGTGKKLRGWGPNLRKAVAGWYLTHEQLPYQLVKYRQREGWTHRDALRLAHPKTDDPKLKQMFDFVCGREYREGWGGIVAGYKEGEKPDIITGFQEAQKPDADLPGLIRRYDLPREALPTEALKEPRVWEALLEKMPLHALVRNLGKLANMGISVDPNRLLDREYIRRSRLHPLSILVAKSVYSQGKGDKGKLTWKPERKIVDALDDAFYKAFDNVKPTGKRIMLALDVSGSMGMGSVAGSPLTPREACAALALVTMRTEPMHHVVGFTSQSGRAQSWQTHHSDDGVSPLGLHPAMNLEEAVRYMAALSFGGTDCSLPMLYAIEKGLNLDAIVILTDNETWAGRVQPAEALVKYRKLIGHSVKLIVVGMTAIGFSIADPSNPDMLDVVGFDTAVPSLINEFIGA